MIEFNAKNNLLENSGESYKLQDVETPNLFRDIYPYDEVPKISFTNHRVPMDMPRDIFMTDTTFRDGQQSREPYSVQQIVDLYDMMHRLGGENGIIRQTEFFVYGKKDRTALEKCRERGYKFPEVTTWIRANLDDFKLVKNIGIKETGILVSCSDYHIFKKLKLTRRQATEKYLSIVKEALSIGLRPRCHLEDITRADFYGFVIPLIGELTRLSREAGIPIKIRACDTMGFGLPYPGVALPRSVPEIIYGLRRFAGLPSELIEWHGHNDFNKAVINATTAWLYGASGVNCSLLGTGERTGNVPLESMAIEYASLRGSSDGMDLSVITEIARYYEEKIGYRIPPMTPFIGRDFNVSRAGIHADGLLKDEEIYNIFDTEKILRRPASIAVTNMSGHAGIAYWINTHFHLEGDDAIDKKDDLIIKIKSWVDKQYEDGRVTSISDREMLAILDEVAPGRFSKVKVGAYERT
jgi:isopropylmalate/homocitrate/citramalate synthase